MSLGKKILSAFIEVEDTEQENSEVHSSENSEMTQNSGVTSSSQNDSPTSETLQKFKAYFDTLLNESKANGPDYFAFSKMIDALSVIPDEKARYIAAFAGLSAQGLSKQQLISTAHTFLDILNNDAAQFNNTINVAIEEKVQGKKAAIDEKMKKIEALSKEITILNESIGIMKQEIKENEEKISVNSAGYNAEFNLIRNRINQDVEKIKQFLN